MAAGALALVLAAAAALLGRGFVDDSPSTKRPKPDEQGLIEFEDERNALKISYPATWSRIAPTDPEVSLVAGTTEASVLLRTRRIGVDVEPEAVDRAKKLTDALVRRGQRIRQLRPPRRIDNLGGLPGWLYIYAFRDNASGERGAHAHYFLFRDDTLITIVFQTLPSERFASYAPLFDRLSATFEAGAVKVGAPD